MSCYSPLERQDERERQQGRILAMQEWDAGHRTPLRDRDLTQWASLSGCVRSGYTSVFYDRLRAMSQTFCVEHQEPDPCRVCRSDAFRAAEMMEVDV